MAQSGLTQTDWKAKNMQDFQQRVIDEKEALGEKLQKLMNFIDGSIFRTLDPEDRKLLQDQRDRMGEYSDILERRIARFANVTMTHQPTKMNTLVARAWAVLEANAGTIRKVIEAAQDVTADIEGKTISRTQYGYILIEEARIKQLVAAVNALQRTMIPGWM